MSRRMYEVLAARVPRVEPYSIDEMFLDLDTLADDPDKCEWFVLANQANTVPLNRTVSKISLSFSATRMPLPSDNAEMADNGRGSEGAVSSV